jgi:hypothetical protein
MSSKVFALGLAVALTASSALASEKNATVIAVSALPRLGVLGSGPGMQVLPDCDVGPSLTPDEKRVVDWAVEEFMRRIQDPHASLDLKDADIVAGTGLDPARLDRDRLYAATAAALVSRLGGQIPPRSGTRS